MAQRLPSYTVTLLADEYDSFARSAPDDDSFPASYDDWLENRTKEDVNKHRRGIVLDEVVVHYEEFITYCRAVGKKPGQTALLAFAVAKEHGWKPKN